MRVIALLGTYNEERFMAARLQNLFRQGVEVHVIDNGSTDETVAIAEQYAGNGVVGIEVLPRAGLFNLRAQLERKEQLASTLEADWFMHVDTDEVQLPPLSQPTLVEAFREAESEGYNVVNFIDFTFVPTRESPDHDHPEFQNTMRWYYPFVPRFPNAMRAWRRQADRVEMAFSGGHRIRFPGLQLSPRMFRMKHYLFLSVPHAIRKYVDKQFEPQETKIGWHNWRASLSPDMIELPSQEELRLFVSDDGLDASNPRTQHYLGASWAAAHARRQRALICDALRHVPCDGVMLVVSKGDDALVTFDDERQVWHFPQDDSGRYLGYHPADSATAIRHLEDLRKRGATYLLFPQPAMWWLDHYTEFRDHIASHYQELFRRDDVGVLFSLGR